MKLSIPALAIASFTIPSLGVAVTIDKPKVPLHSSSRWILGADNQRVKLRCINWAGHLEVNVPEGLHKQPVNYIASWIANQGFNCVRLTYSIDMALNNGIGHAGALRRRRRQEPVPRQCHCYRRL
ncbi:hypothetical protein NQ176_g10774 [Zarea fungicola]|uniref:Uncharacterized protein n=1 Tax=Zarea fungicola TaxID=93591 RepID=A0ACC1MEH7_9HYPO|nr:hypothetical protein NQ176_g10774 [Lecanicillium fungicola]